MALDSNLFTLSFERRHDNPTILDLVPFTAAAAATRLPAPLTSGSSSSNRAAPLYAFSRARSAHYSVRLIDSLTDIVLASIECPYSNDKGKTIQLYNPDETVLLDKRQMTFKQDWRWSWQENEFSVRRDGRSYIVEAVRKPDPEIDIARYTPSTKNRPGMLQMLDYNIQRLDLSDRRGLEIITISTVCHLLDQEYDESNREGGNIYMDGSVRQGSGTHAPLNVMASVPPSSSATNSIAARPQEANELVLDLHTPNDAYIEHALRLLRQDDAGEGLHMIVIRADSTELTPRAVRIAAEVKARWYKLPAIVKGRTLDPMPGSVSETAEELYQYVRDPALLARQQQKQRQAQTAYKAPIDASAGPRGRIKLGGGPMEPAATSSPGSPSIKKKDQAHSNASGASTPLSISAPPTQLHIYLSKDRIDEFEQTAFTSSTQTATARTPHAVAVGQPAPSIPPKMHAGTGGGGRVTSSPMQQHASLANADSSSGGGGGAKKFFGKLGIRKPDA